MVGGGFMGRRRRRVKERALAVESREKGTAMQPRWRSVGNEGRDGKVKMGDVSGFGVDGREEETDDVPRHYGGREKGRKKDEE